MASRTYTTHTMMVLTDDVIYRLACLRCANSAHLSLSECSQHHAYQVAESPKRARFPDSRKLGAYSDSSYGGANLCKTLADEANSNRLVKP